MGEKDFQQEVIDRLARIETKQDAMAKTVECNTTTINQHSERITKTEEGTKSAHHRIGGIYAAAGTLGALAGTVVQAIWPKGGH